MKRFTVSIPKELKDKLDKMPDINWPEVAKEGVIEKLAKLVKFEELENMGELRNENISGMLRKTKRFSGTKNLEEL